MYYLKTRMMRTVVKNLCVLVFAFSQFQTIHAQPACSEVNSIATSKWQLVGLSCDPIAPNDTVAKIFGDDLDVAQYNRNWVLYSRDLIQDKYIRLSLSSKLKQGEGYWIYTILQGSYDVEGDNALVVSKSVNPHCPSADGCFEIDLTSPDDHETVQHNLLAHPFLTDTQWKDVCLYDGVTSYSPSQADALGLMSKNIYKYNGNAYETFDDVTVGLLGVLEIHDGFWIKLLENAKGKSFKLLIPTGVVTDTCGKSAPVIEPIADQQAQTQVNFALQVIATDPDVGDTVSYSLTQAPAGMSIDPAGLIQWVPTDSQLGGHAVTVRASDQTGLFDEEDFNITVTKDNNPPDLIAPGDRTIQANKLFSTQLFAIDPDIGDDLIFDLVQMPEGMEIDDDTGILSWTPTDDDVGMMNHVIAKVSDSGSPSLYDMEEFDIEVIEEILPPPNEDNNPPQLTIPGDIIQVINNPYTATATATDPEGDDLTFILINGPAGLSINEDSGQISWNAPGEGDIGQHDVAIKVEDEHGAIDTGSYIITVIDINKAPTANDEAYQVNFGEILEVPAPGVLENDTDPNDDPLTAMLVTPPGKGALTFNADGSFVYEPNAVANTALRENINLSFQMPPLVVASSQLDGFPPSEVIDDILLFSIWLSEHPLTPNAPDHIEQQFALPVVVREIQLFGLRNFPAGRDFIKGNIELFNDSGQLLYESGELDLVDLDQNPHATFQDVVHTLATPVANVTRVRFTGTERVNPNLSAGMSEFHVIGDVDAEALLVASEFSWESSLILPTSLNVISSPVVADINLDGVPDIVFATSASSSSNNEDHPGPVRAISGDGSGELFTVEDTSHFVAATSQLAVGNLDADPELEIVGLRSNRTGLIVFEHDGTVKWMHDAFTFPVPDIAPVVLADLDADNSPEILIGSTNGQMNVFDASGALLWDQSKGHTSRNGAVPAVADINLDGQPEIVSGSVAFDAQGNILWQGLDAGGSELEADRFNAIGNFDDDPYPEIIVGKSFFGIYMLEHDGSYKWGPVKTFELPAYGRSVGPPTVADFDNDGDAEIGVAGADRYTVIEGDGSVKWAVFVNDVSSGFTGSTVFDFEGDGKVEVVYSDEDNLYVYDGATGLIKFETEFKSGTLLEYPLVADVDADGSAEIIAVANDMLDDSGTSPQKGVFVFGSPTDDWASTRPIWNQYTYHVTDANLDGSIPAVEQNNWLTPGLNNFRQNQFLPDETEDAVDSFTYKANDGNLDSNIATVSIELLPVNTAPEFTSIPLETATAGFDYFYGAAAIDAENDTISFSLSQGPVGMTVDAATGLVSWSPSDSELGIHQVAIQVTDSKGFSNIQFYTLSVTLPVVVPDVTGLDQAQAESDLAAANLQSGVIRSLNHPTAPVGAVIMQSPPAGATVEISTAVDLMISLGPTPEDIDDDGDGISENQGDCNDADRSIFPGAADTNGDGIDQDCDGIDGNLVLDQILIEPSDSLLLVGQQLELNATGIFDNGTSQNLTAVANWSIGSNLFDATSAGSFNVTASHNGVSGTAAITVEEVIDDDIPPEAEITTPIAGSTITAPTDITGTASDANLFKYTLEIAPAGQDNFIEITNSNVEVIDGVLGEFDPTLLLNDLYTVRLTVYDSGGNIAVDEKVYQVDENMKVGNFSLTFTDLQIPMSGIPITVNRTYDSRDKRVGDFGVGWRLDVQTLICRANRVLGTGWEVVRSGLSFQLVPTDEHKVSITLPGGRVEEFDMVVSPSVSPLIPFPPFANRVSFKARPGTLGTLQSLDNNFLTILDPQPGEISLLDDSTNRVYNPQRFRYIQPDGTEIIISKDSGVEKITEPNGNTLEFRDDGIFHSAGKQALFERDTEGRITRLTDPNGNDQLYGYDANGDLVSHTDRESNKTKFRYNRYHGLIEIMNPIGNIPLKNVYDDNGRLIKQIDALGNELLFTHSLNTNQEIITDRSGAVTVFEYDDKGNILSETDARGNRTIYTYDTEGNQLTKSDAQGNTWNYEYNELRQKTKISNPDGTTILDVYDANGNLLSNINERNLKTEYKYDSNNNAIRKTDPLGNSEEISYTASGDMAFFKRKDGSILSFSYDTNGFPTSITYPNFQSINKSFDALGNEINKNYTVSGRSSLLTITNLSTYDKNDLLLESANVESNRRIVRSYNSNRQLVKVVDEMGDEWNTKYNERGEIIESDGPSGTKVTQTYDPEGRTTFMSSQDSEEISRQYDLVGNTISIGLIDSDGITRTWDSLNRLAESTDINGLNKRFEYDALGRETKAIYPGGEITRSYSETGYLNQGERLDGGIVSYEYDALDRKTKITKADGRELYKSYNLLDNPVSMDIQPGLRWIYEYNALDKISKSIDPSGNEYSFGYNSIGILESITAPADSTTVFEYDGLNQLLAYQLPGGQTSSYTYDEVGRVTKVRKFDGTEVNLTYDRLNFEMSREVNGSVDIFNYDHQGRPTKLTSDGKVMAVDYDRFGRTTRWSDLNGLVTENKYFSSGLPSQLISFGRITNLSFDTSGLSNSVEFDGHLTSFSKSPAGFISGIDHSNGLNETRSYNLVDRLSSKHYEIGSQTLLGLTFEYGDYGNIDKITYSDGITYNFAYDVNGRLISEVKEDSGQIDNKFYTYDARGNITSVNENGQLLTLDYDINDRLIYYGGATLSWDANGNLLSIAEASGSENYSYDSYDRLVQYRKTGFGESDIQINYEYSLDGLLISRKILNGDSTFYTWDRTGNLPILLEELDENFDLKRRYFNDGVFITHSVNQSGQFEYYILNQLGSPIAVVDSTGDINTRIEYDAYGNSLGSAGSIGYTNGVADTISGMQYLRSRWYHPKLRRFIQMDSAPAVPMMTKNFNRYQYALGDPINRFDPTGQLSILGVSFSNSLTATIAVGTGLIGIGTGASLITNAIFPGGLFNGNHTPTANFLPEGVFTINGGVSSGPFSLGVDGGFERIIIEASGKKAIYGFLGPSSGAGMTFLRKKVKAPGGTFSVNVAIIGKSQIYNVYEPNNYEGWFNSISGSLTPPKLLSRYLASGASSLGAGSSFFWSTHSSGDNDRPSSWGVRGGVSTGAKTGGRSISFGGSMSWTNFWLIGTDDDLDDELFYSFSPFH